MNIILLGILFFLLFVVEFIYLKIANYFNIVDKPNERSSHQFLTIRGGGIIFIFAIWISTFIYSFPILVAVAITLAGAIGFIDDIYKLHQIPRIIAHLIALILIIFSLNEFEFNIFILILIGIVFTGWVNAFNFMDGINGITGFYGLTALISFFFIPELSVYSETILTVIFSIIVFGYYNFRAKAKTFAGDVGSISLAFILGYFMLYLMKETGKLEYILFFAVYGMDAVFTIIFRLIRGENIFTPHRTHLYQYLANELNYSHLAVSFIYSSIQFMINFLLLICIKKELISAGVFIVILFTFALIYLFLRDKVIKQLKTENAN
jgi:UDP-N-acetylmuramyl pentapeptide phosphotransferase/UDP-N-acetylglucosamine-1-phosphate transferase